MLLAAGLDFLECRNILGHRHYLRAGLLLDQGIAFLMITMRVAPQQYFGIGKLEPQLLDRLFNGRYIPFIRTVNEDIALRRDHEERAQSSRADIVDVPDDLVRRK